MREIIISPGEAGGRFDRYLGKYLRQASRSFLYKMLRKKNITLNGAKADGSEILQSGDHIKLFFSDETLEKFTAGADKASGIPRIDLDIIYEDDDVIFINKPAGMLSQKARPEDISLCEYLAAYLADRRGDDPDGRKVFSPGVCNRLDRNTSGLITAGKTLRGLQSLSEAFRERKADKYYLAIVRGELSQNTGFDGYLTKDAASNTVSLGADGSSGGEHVSTEIYPLYTKGGYSLVRVKLLTGKTHQIRATMQYLGYPIVGDKKYGAADLSLARRQLLHSYELVFKDTGERFIAAPPKDFTDTAALLGLSMGE